MCINIWIFCFHNFCIVFKANPDRMSTEIHNVKLIIEGILEILIKSPPDESLLTTMKKRSQFFISVMEKALGDITDSSFDKKVVFVGTIENF